MTPEGCSDDVDSTADSDPAVDDSEASSSDGGEEAMDRLRQLEYDTMQAKRQAIMSSNRLWSAEEKADYEQWPLILGDRRKADEWTLKDTIPILKLPVYMATELFRYWEKRLNIVAFLMARAEGPIPRVPGGSDRPTIPYAEWERVIVKPRVPKKGDLMPRTEFTRQPDGNACGVFVCRTMETLVAAVAFQSELDWSWSPLKPLQDNFYADQRAYMLDVVIHPRLRCDTELETNSNPLPSICKRGLELLRCFPKLSHSRSRRVRRSSKRSPRDRPALKFPRLVLIDPSIGTIPRPNPAPSIATIGSTPDAPLMRLQRVVRFDPTPPLPVSEALEVVACLPRYQTRTLAVRSIVAISTPVGTR
ncbi:BQ5605_C015g07769 [Microbotryum silenes-dioicae]|uniref:BQ5605_C015g07769 protein n=1 Tax=Microbotryum silenes-dioicae TaxID=796604 RepID=A0A2X0LX01_9BASI|nr:BQ5605_C015g07769 [Microbotryum silenes-dioicae]